MVLDEQMSVVCGVVLYFFTQVEETSCVLMLSLSFTGIEGQDRGGWVYNEMEPRVGIS